MSMYNRTYWNNWCIGLWRKAQIEWINRKGQDYYYRDYVVIPAVMKHLHDCPPIATIIDLGCGDGYTLEAILNNNNSPFNGTTRIVLVDRSISLLNTAKNRFKKNSLKAIHCDLHSIKWLSHVINASTPKLLLCAFVLQEMPSLKDFLRLVNKALGRLDIFVAIVVDPDYAISLSGIHCQMNKIGRKELEGKDWEWASVYPISTNSHTIYLPYFHRSLEDYKKIFEINGLVLNTMEALSVPNTPAAHKIYQKTVYTEAIIEISSSQLLIATKNI